MEQSAADKRIDWEIPAGSICVQIRLQAGTLEKKKKMR